MLKKYEQPNFENLFVLELANNHWGSLKRGKQIIKQFAKIVKNNNIKAAIKLQFRDVDTFIHKNFKPTEKNVDLASLPKDLDIFKKLQKQNYHIMNLKNLSNILKNMIVFLCQRLLMKSRLIGVLI